MVRRVTRQHSGTALRLGAIIGALSIAACGDKPTRESGEPAAPLSEHTPPAASAPTAAAPMARKSAEAPEKAAPPAATPPGGAAVPEPVPEPPPKLEGVAKFLPDAISAKNTAYPKLVRDIYAKQKWRLLFVAEDGTPSAQATKVADLVNDLENHGVDPGPYLLRGPRPVDGHYPAYVLVAPRAPADAAALDVRLTHAVLRYWLDFRFLVKAHPVRFFEKPEEHLQKGHRVIVDAVTKLFPDVEAGLIASWPKHPAYGAIRAVLPRYRELAAKAPKFAPLDPKRTLEVGAHGAIVKDVQRRLAAEGFYEGEPSGTIDETTQKALRSYQETHYLEPIGKVGKGTLKALSVGPKERLRQLETSLQRWRESDVTRDGPKTYFRVNLPAFELVFSEDGQVTRRQRVIVGSNQLDADISQWIQGNLNRTKLLTTRLFQIQLNPTWLVPKRIRDLELPKMLERDPDHFEKKGYKKVTLKDGTETIQQGSGKKNALGRVKFMLEKTDAIYLHDTDRPWLFRQHVRDFSHGCMRVQDAVELGKYLAMKYTGITEEKYNNLLGSGGTQPLNLKNPIPLYIEYNTVDVDADGRVVFYEDIYQYDAAYAGGKLPVVFYTRYGSAAMRPHWVPLIQPDDFKALKAKGGTAPLEWPPGSKRKDGTAPEPRKKRPGPKRER